MTAGGWASLILCWGFVISATVWLLGKTLRK